jgi:protein-disulfide isomerase
VCGEQEPIIDSLLKEYGNRINYVFRHFPLEQIHPDAASAAEASECIGSQGKFWPAYDKFYAEQADLTPEALTLYAKDLNIDMAAFKVCMDDHLVRQRIEDDMTDADALGIGGTPTFFINGHRLLGLHSHGEFVKAIDGLLGGADSLGKPR